MKLLELFLTENRIDYTIQTFGKKLEDAYKKDPSAEYEEMEAGNIVDSLLKYDPSPQNKFIVWIAKLYSDRKLKIEDLYKVKEYLSLFSKVQQKLDKKDIMQYASLPELYSVLQKYIENEEEQLSGKEKARSKREKLVQEGEAEVVYDKDGIKVVKVNTQDAACEFGKGTQWCTAATTSANAFEYYNKGSDLYVILTPTSDRFQMEVNRESKQLITLADEHDQAMSVIEAMEDHYPPIKEPIVALYKAGIIKASPPEEYEDYPLPPRHIPLIMGDKEFQKLNLKTRLEWLTHYVIATLGQDYPDLDRSKFTKIVKKYFPNKSYSSVIKAISNKTAEIISNIPVNELDAAIGTEIDHLVIGLRSLFTIEELKKYFNIAKIIADNYTIEYITEFIDRHNIREIQNYGISLKDLLANIYSREDLESNRFVGTTTIANMQKTDTNVLDFLESLYAHENKQVADMSNNLLKNNPEYAKNLANALLTPTRIKHFSSGAAVDHLLAKRLPENVKDLIREKIKAYYKKLKNNERGVAKMPLSVKPKESNLKRTYVEFGGDPSDLETIVKKKREKTKDLSNQELAIDRLVKHGFIKEEGFNYDWFAGPWAGYQRKLFGNTLPSAKSPPVNVDVSQIYVAALENAFLVLLPAHYTIWMIKVPYKKTKIGTITGDTDKKAVKLYDTKNTKIKNNELNADVDKIANKMKKEVGYERSYEPETEPYEESVK